LAIRIPAPAARKAAAVEMLKVVIAPPPVPQVSTSVAGFASWRDEPGVAHRPGDGGDLGGSLALDPEPDEERAIWTGVASPDMTRSKAAVNSAPGSIPRRPVS